MTTEWVTVPREPTEAMVAAGRSYAVPSTQAIIPIYTAMLSACPPSPPVSGANDDVRNRVSECRIEYASAGHWRSCSGCYETEDGYPVGSYTDSKAFGCVLGGGCSECGGIGAIWDTTDYDDMVAFMLKAESAPPVSGEVVEALETALIWMPIGFASTSRPGSAGDHNARLDAAREKVRSILDRLASQEPKP